MTFLALKLLKVVISCKEVISSVLLKVQVVSKKWRPFFIETGSPEI